MSVKITIAAKWTRDGNKMSTKMLYLKFKVGPILDNGKNGCCRQSFLKTAVNQNSDPFPAALWTPIDPFISSANCFAMAKPSPVPPYVLVVLEST